MTRIQYSHFPSIINFFFTMAIFLHSTNNTIKYRHLIHINDNKTVVKRLRFLFGKYNCTLSSFLPPVNQFILCQCLFQWSLIRLKSNIFLNIYVLTFLYGHVFKYMVFNMIELLSGALIKSVNSRDKINSSNLPAKYRSWQKVNF